MIMDQKIREVLDRFEETGTGSSVPLEDLDAVQEYVTSLIAQAEGITLGEAIDLTRLLQWGHWAEGWTTGYASGARRFAPRFSLNGGK
jgi:hypothetical protein